MSWLRDLLENPVYRLEMLRAWRSRHKPGVKPAPARPPWRLWLLGWTLCVVAPYAGHPLARWEETLTGISPQTASSPDPVLGNLLAVGAIAMTAAHVAAWLAGSAGVCLAGERARRTLTPLILTRLTPAEVLLGKGMAVALRSLAGLSLCFLVWTAIPPLPAGADLLFAHLGQPPRELVAFLWADTIAACVTLTYLGLAVSAGCRSARAAGVLTGVALVATYTLGVEVLAVLAARSSMVSVTALVQPQIALPLVVHAGIWAGCAAVAILSFMVAQALLDPVPAHVRLFPGGSTWFRLSRRGAMLMAALLAALALAGTAVVGLRMAHPFTGSGAYPGSGRILRRLDDFISRHRYRDAIALADTELQRGWPRQMATWLWGYKALGHWQLREHREAAIAFDQEHRLSSRTYTTIGDLKWVGRCLKELGEKRQAAREYRHALAVVEQRIPNVADRWKHSLVDGLPYLGRQIALCGDREGAREAFELAMREGDRETVREAWRDLLLLEAGLHAAPRLDIYTQGASLVVAGSLTGTGVLPTGLDPGDRIVRVDGRPVQDLVGLYRILARCQPRQRVILTAERAGKTIEVRTQLRRP